MKKNILQWLTLLFQPEALVFLPALTVLSYWFAGEIALLVLAVAVPLIIALARPISRKSAPAEPGNTSMLLALLDEFLKKSQQNGHATGCIVLQFDEVECMRRRHGRAAVSDVMLQQYERLCSIMRQGDLITAPHGQSVAIVLSPMRDLDHKAMIQICERLQRALADPITIGRGRLYLRASIGFHVSGSDEPISARDMLDAAQAASDEAVVRAPGSIRAYTRDLALQQASRLALKAELEHALDEGQFIAYFQPQFDARTGALSGLEALARWKHPTRGCLPPSAFLAMIEAHGLHDRLGEAILNQSLAWMVDWQAAGIHVPTVAVNFSAPELRHPELPARIEAALRAHGLAPQRLAIEVLETVVVTGDTDVIASNIARLAKLGCGIDLDDFGTGHASISAIRGFEVDRLKIDRSLITQLDRDPAQQRMVTAILSLARQLELTTLAEGVETSGEKAALINLGVDQMQGYGLAHPMPAKELAAWLRAQGLVPDARSAQS